MNDLPQFHVQPVLSELYDSKDLLDFSGPPTPPQPSTSSPSLFQSASSIAAAAGRRAAAAASSTSNQPSSPQQQHTASTGGSAKEIRCVEGFGQNMYVGASDGTVEWWVCDGSPGASAMNGWSMKHRHTLFPRRPVSRLYVLPKISKLLIVSDGTLHALGLPNLEPLPSSHVPPLRGVLSVILDDEELDWGGPGSEDPNAQMTVVVVRRKGLGVYKLGNRMSAVKELPLPAPPTEHALFASYLCAAIPSITPDQSPLYSLIDLSDASLTEVLPVTQIDQAVAEFDVNPNVVVIPGENEFLVTSYTGSSTMGVFLNGQGDPVRGTMEWASHPLRIAVESGYIIALLRNHTIVIHSLEDLDVPAQTVELSLGAFDLTYSPYGISVRDLVRDERLGSYRLKLLGGKLAPPKPIETRLPVPDPGTVNASADSTADLPSSGDGVISPTDGLSPTAEDPPSGSGLTPPSSPRRAPVTPQRGSSLPSSTSISTGPFSTAVAETLIIGRHTIQSLTPTPVILRLEALCSERKMEEAISLVDDERRRGRRGEIDVDKSTHQSTMRYMHLYLAAHLLEEAMFDKAQDYWIRGKVDPRILVRCYTDLRGKVIGSEEEVDSYAGLQKVLEDMPSVEEIISSSIKRNYSPHVQPNSATAPETSVLRSAMQEEARDMLAECLRKTRTSRRKGGGSRGIDSRKIDIVIDTTLAKLLADKGTTNELLALLAAPNDCVFSELEPFLEKRPYVLVTVMRTQGRVDRVLELLKEIADTGINDPICEDPVEELAQQLESVKDPQLFLKYALWVVEKRPTRGLSVSLDVTGVRLDEVQLVDDLRKIDETIANKYIEHAIVTKRSPSRVLHQQLLDVLLDEAEMLCADDGVRYHLEELDAEYRLEPEPRPFPIFLAEIAPDTPVKRNRLKTMLFLQGSPFFDLEAAAKKLEGMELLKYELAIIYGRLAKHRKSLSLLALTIGDSISAQTYCTTQGEIIPPKIARSTATSSRIKGMDGWATLGEVGRRKKEVKEDEMRGLVKELLGVYMSDSKGTSKQAAALLNAQSVHLDVLEVLGQMPNEWPLDEVSSFIKRSMRRGMHERATWGVLKAISAGQNLEVSEEYLNEIRRIPPVVRRNHPGRDRRANDDLDPNLGYELALGHSPPDEGSIAEKEWNSYDEKGLVDDEMDGDAKAEAKVEEKVGSDANDNDKVRAGGVGVEGEKRVTRQTDNAHPSVDVGVEDRPF
ncbi:hypothetical protein I317_05719 [Kwoniella heveanensis CBS 569]|nr:hypothetical protein I317_05719 [Kwoniella heveanensis CBS 569]